MNEEMKKRIDFHWGNIENGEIITDVKFFHCFCDQTMSSKDVKYAKDYLIQKAIEGEALRIPDRHKKVPLHFEKITEETTQYVFMEKLFNTLKIRDCITSKQFFNMLPKKFQYMKRVLNFFQHLKTKGCLVVPTNGAGQVIKVDVYQCYKKIRNVIIKTENRKFSIPRQKNTKKQLKKTKHIIGENKKAIKNMSKETVEKLMYDKTPTETGMAIFHATLDLLTQNETLKAENKSLLEEKAQLESTLSDMENVMKKRQSEKVTFKSFKVKEMGSDIKGQPS